jgi:hypothetical protein
VAVHRTACRALKDLCRRIGAATPLVMCPATASDKRRLTVSVRAVIRQMGYAGPPIAKHLRDEGYRDDPLTRAAGVCRRWKRVLCIATASSGIKVWP